LHGRTLSGRFVIGWYAYRRTSSKTCVADASPFARKSGSVASESTAPPALGVIQNAWPTRGCVFGAAAGGAASGAVAGGAATAGSTSMGCTATGAAAMARGATDTSAYTCCTENTPDPSSMHVIVGVSR
jgi:hypothetical protein